MFCFFPGIKLTLVPDSDARKRKFYSSLGASILCAAVSLNSIPAISFRAYVGKFHAFNSKQVNRYLQILENR